MKVDLRVQSRLKNTRSFRPSTQSTGTTAAGPSQSRPTNLISTAVNIRGSTPRAPGPRGPLTEEEKARRRREGRCLYCNDLGHIARECPKAQAARSFAATRVEGPLLTGPEHPTPVAGALATVTEDTTPVTVGPALISIPENPLTFASLKSKAGRPRLTLEGKTEGEDVSIMVDCAADGIFVDERLVAKNPQ